MLPQLVMMVRRRRRQCLVSALLLLSWLVYRHLINSRGAGPLVLLNNKIVKCINNEDYFNISSNRIYRKGNSEAEKSCKFVGKEIQVEPFLHDILFNFSFVS